MPSSLPPAEGLSDVILYFQPDDKKKNRGFCFLEYEDHKAAAQARRRLMSGKVKVWGNVVTVEWADPIEDPDPEVMAKVSKQPETDWGEHIHLGLSLVCMCVCVKVKVLFVRNLAGGVTEELLEKSFSQFGKLERVKKLKDYAFIHFEERDGAVKVALCPLEAITPAAGGGDDVWKVMLTSPAAPPWQALDEMNGKELEGEPIEIVFAKPPDQKRKERKAQRQAAKTHMWVTLLTHPHCLSVSHFVLLPLAHTHTQNLSLARMLSHTDVLL